MSFCLYIRSTDHLLWIFYLFHSNEGSKSNTAKLCTELPDRATDGWKALYKQVHRLHKKKPRPPPTNPWSITSDMKIESDRWKNTHQIEIGHLNCIVMKMQKISHFCIFALNILNKVDSDHAYVQWFLHLIKYNCFAGLGNQWDTWVSWKKKHIYIYTIYMSTLPPLIQLGVYKIISK